MSEDTVKTIFKVVGVIHILMGLFMLCVSVLAIVGIGALTAGNEMLEAYGETAVETVPMWLTIYSIGVGFLSTAMYFASAFGFLKLMKWQPIVYTVVFVLTILSMIGNLLSTGLVAGTFVSIFFMFVWGGLLYLVWTNKKLFTN